MFPHCVILWLLSLLAKQSAAAEFPSVLLCLMAEPSGPSEFILSRVCVRLPMQTRHVCASLAATYTWICVSVRHMYPVTRALCTFSSTQNQSALLPIRVTISKVAAHNDITAAAVSE